jgi:magnesium-transporting ATPase (P-type)
MDDPIMDYETLPKSQELIDAGNLNALTLCHFILGGVTALFSCMFIIHIVMGTMMLHNPGMFTPRPMPQAAPSAPPYPGQLSPGQPYPFFPSFMGYMFVTVGTIAVLGGWTLGALTAYAGRCLKARRNYLYILIIAGCNCGFVMPFGTVLGVFTFIVMTRPTVKALFAQ